MEQSTIYLPKEFKKQIKSTYPFYAKSISEFCEKALRFYISFLEKNKETAQV